MRTGGITIQINFVIILEKEEKIIKRNYTCRANVIVCMRMCVQ